MRRLAGLAMIALALLVTACGPSSKEDMVAKAREVKTRAELERALGKADDVSKLGPLEKWTYKARNGQVVFVLVGDVVTLEAAGPPDKKD
jgi:major membrane immunogen (membrane-anchored lipoprotein)